MTWKFHVFSTTCQVIPSPNPFLDKFIVLILYQFSWLLPQYNAFINKENPLHIDVCHKNFSRVTPAYCHPGYSICFINAKLILKLLKFTNLLLPAYPQLFIQYFCFLKLNIQRKFHQH